MAGRRLALIVATDVYEDPGLHKLRAPAEDAEALADVLGDPELGDFEVSTLHNETHWAIGQRVEALLADAKLDDLIVLHFSCHGIKDDTGELYLAATNTRPNLLATTAVEAALVNRLVRRSRSQRIVLLLDCCFGGAFERGMTARAAGDVDVSDQFRQRDQDLGGGRGRVVITASSAMEFAFEGSDLADSSGPRPSIFTGSLVDGLRSGAADRDNDGMFSLGEVYDYVFDRVRQASPNQTPNKFEFGVQGEFILARNPQRVVVPGPVPARFRRLAGDPYPATRTGSIADLKRLAEGTDLPLAAGARQQIDRMVEDDSRQVAAAASAALADLALRVSVPSVDFGEVTAGSAPPIAEVSIEGPPLAVASRVNSSVPAFHVRKVDRLIRIEVDTSTAGRIEGVVRVEGAAGTVEIPVSANVQAAFEPSPAVAVAAPAPLAAATQAAAEPVPAAAASVPATAVSAPAAVVSAPTPEPVPAVEPARRGPVVVTADEPSAPVSTVVRPATTARPTTSNDPWQSVRRALSGPMIGAIAAVVIVATGGFLVLRGGGSGSSTFSPSPAGAATPEPTLVSVGSPAPTQPAVAASLAGSLTIWHSYESGAEADAMATVIGRLSTDNPDLKVSAKAVPFSDLADKFRTAAAAGTGPDLFLWTNDTLGQEVQSKLVADISPFVGDGLSNVAGGAIASASFEKGLYIVPESAQSVVMYFNQSKLKEPPGATSELLDGITSGTIRAGFPKPVYFNVGWASAFGSRLLDDSGKCHGDDTGTIEAFGFMRELAADGARWYTDPNEMAKEFKSGKLDLIVDGSWNASDYESTLKDNLAVAPLPRGPSGDEAQPWLALTGWYVNANSTDVKLAVEAAIRLVKPDYEAAFVQVGHVPTDTTTPIDDPLRQQVSQAVARGAPKPQISQLNAFWGPFGDAVVQVVDDGVDPTKSVADACAKMNAENKIP
jgi:maltose-binding protein MalE